MTGNGTAGGELNAGGESSNILGHVLLHWAARAGGVRPCRPLVRDSGGLRQGMSRTGRGGGS